MVPARRSYTNGSIAVQVRGASRSPKLTLEEEEEEEEEESLFKARGGGGKWRSARLRVGGVYSY